MTPTLSDEMRAWLGARCAGHALLYDTVLAFIRTFKVSPNQTGELIAQWIRETV